MSARLVVEGVRKAFGATAALDGVSLSVDAGEAHAVLGENGAGKSTLMAILGGALAPDAGRMTLDGAVYSPRDPAAARDAGVAMVHQELSLCKHLSVAENIALGREPNRFGVIDRRARDAAVDAVMRRVLGDEWAHRISADARVGDLSPADQQLVEIARALAGLVNHEARAPEGRADAKCRVLILDEPTSSLASDDAERLFAIVRKLCAEGISVLYISHFLEEVRNVADRFTVLRDGATVATGAIAGTTIADLVSSMAGRRVEQLFPRSERRAGEVLLRVRGVTVPAPVRTGTRSRSRLEQVPSELEVRRGEIVGIAGLVGAGRTELLRAIFGLDEVTRGEVTVGTQVGFASPARRLAQKVGMLSEDRKGEGLALTLSIADNVTLSKSPAILSLARQRAAAQRWLDELAVRARDPDQRVSELSGGNQQKIALARLLHHDVDLLLLDEPTRGIDVASKAQIYATLDRLAASGKAILMTSSYLPELFGVCDRIAVMCKGTLGDARPVGDWTEHAILQAATGSA